MVWPEAAVPGWFQFDADVRGPILDLARTNSTWMVIGADELAYREGPRDAISSYDAYNSSYLIDRQGTVRQTYRKRRLVIFGEYVPLSRWLPFLKHLTPISGGFATGHGRRFERRWHAGRLLESQCHPAAHG